MPSPNNKYKSKRARLEEYYKNPNVQAYLAGIRFTETGGTGLNWNAKNPKSTARGPYQFLDSSQKDILNNWGVNAYSKDPKEVHLAALGLMAYKPQGLESIKKGDFKKADTMYNKYWTSLPGGAEPNMHTPKLGDVRAKELSRLTKPVAPKPIPAPEPGYFEKFMTGYNAPFNDSKTDYNFPTRFIGGLQEVFGVDTTQPVQKQKHGGRLTKKGKKRRKYGPRPDYMNQNPNGMTTGPITQRSIGNTPGGGYMQFAEGGFTTQERQDKGLYVHQGETPYDLVYNQDGTYSSVPMGMAPHYSGQTNVPTSPCGPGFAIDYDENGREVCVPVGLGQPASPTPPAPKPSYGGYSGYTPYVPVLPRRTMQEDYADPGFAMNLTRRDLRQLARRSREAQEQFEPLKKSEAEVSSTKAPKGQRVNMGPSFFQRLGRSIGSIFRKCLPGEECYKFEHGGWTGYPDHTMYSSAMKQFDDVRRLTKYADGGLTEPTRQDSLNVYNYAINQDEHYKKIEPFVKKRISSYVKDQSEYDKIVKKVKEGNSTLVKTSNLPESQKKLILNNNNPNIVYGLGAGNLSRDYSNTLLNMVDKRIKPQQFISYEEEHPYSDFLKKRGSNDMDFRALRGMALGRVIPDLKISRWENTWYGGLRSVDSTIKANEVIKEDKNNFLKKFPDITEAELNNLINKEAKSLKILSGEDLGRIYYDPLAVAPFDILNDAQKIERVKKYGFSGVPQSYIKSNKKLLPNKKPVQQVKSQNPKPEYNITQSSEPMGPQNMEMPKLVDSIWTPYGKMSRADYEKQFGSKVTERDLRVKKDDGGDVSQAQQEYIRNIGRNAATGSVTPLYGAKDPIFTIIGGAAGRVIPRMLSLIPSPTKPAATKSEQLPEIPKNRAVPPPHKGLELSPELEPYMSSTRRPATREEQVFESFLSPKRRAELDEERTTYYDSKGNIIPRPKKAKGGTVWSIVEDRPMAGNGLLVPPAGMFDTGVQRSDATNTTAQQAVQNTVAAKQFQSDLRNPRVTESQFKEKHGISREQYRNLPSNFDVAMNQVWQGAKEPFKFIGADPDLIRENPSAGIPQALAGTFMLELPVDEMYQAGKQGISGLKKALGKRYKEVPTITTPIDVSRNLEDLNAAQKFAEQYGYELPANLERISQSNVLTDRTIRGLMNRHNTFVRGVSTNWEELAKRNPEILRHLEGKGFDLSTKEGTKAAAEYMATHIPINTGYGRASLNRDVFDQGLEGLYTSNSMPTAEGYTYGQGFITKVKKPTNYSSSNRQDWITQNNPQYYEHNLSGGNTLMVDGKVTHPINMKLPYLYSVKDYDNINVFKNTVIKDLEKQAASLKEIFEEKAITNPQYSQNMKNSYDEIVKRIEDIKAQKWETANVNFDKNLLKTEHQSQSFGTDFGGFGNTAEDVATNLSSSVQDQVKHSENLMKLTKQVGAKNNKKIAELTEEYADLLAKGENELTLSEKIKLESLEKEILDLRWNSKNEVINLHTEYLNNNFPNWQNQKNRYAHYIHLGTPGQKVLEPIKSWEITPEIWKNKSRSHSNRYSKKLSAMNKGGAVTWQIID